MVILNGYCDGCGVLVWRSVHEVVNSDLIYYVVYNKKNMDGMALALILLFLSCPTVFGKALKRLILEAVVFYSHKYTNFNSTGHIVWNY